MPYFFILLISASLFCRLAEARLHVLNVRYLASMGARPHRLKLGELFWAAESLCLAAVVLEAFFPLAHSPRWLVLTGLSVMLSASLAGFWIKKNLGALWSRSLIYLPGRLEEGQSIRVFRLLQLGHFFSALEIIGLSLCLSSFLTLIAYLGLCLVFLPGLVVIERRVLRCY